MICLDSRVGPWVAERVGGIWTGVHETAIGWTVDGELTAGAMYEKYIAGRSIVTHLVIERGLSREFLLFCFDYGFRQLGIQQSIVTVDSANTKALRLNAKLGYTERCRIPDAARNGDLVVMTLDRKGYEALRARYGR